MTGRQIKDLISKSKISEAIATFMTEDLSLKVESELHQLKQRLSFLEEKSRKGIIKNEDETIQRNQISESLLMLVNQHFDSNLDRSIREKPIKTKWPLTKRNLTYVLTFLILVSIIYLIRPKIYSSNNCEGLSWADSNRIQKNYKNTADTNKVKVNISDQHMQSVEVNIENKYGDIQIVDLWVELEECRKCVPADIFLDVEYTDNNYYIPLTQHVNKYRLMPQTFSNNIEPDIIDNKGLKTFIIRFSTMNHHAYKVKFCANIIDGFFSEKIYLESKPFWFYGRKCLEIKNEKIKIENFQPQIQPYIYKLMTGAIWSKISQSPDDLNLKAYCQIAKELGLSLEELDLVIENNQIDAFKGLKNYPEPYDRVLFEIAKRLKNIIE